MKHNFWKNLLVLAFVIVGPIGISVISTPPWEKNFPIWLEIVSLLCFFASAVVIILGIIMAFAIGLQNLEGTLVIPYLLALTIWAGWFVQPLPIEDSHLIVTLINSDDWLWISTGISLIWFAVTSFDHAGFKKTLVAHWSNTPKSASYAGLGAIVGWACVASWLWLPDLEIISSDNLAIVGIAILLLIGVFLDSKLNTWQTSAYLVLILVSIVFGVNFLPLIDALLYFPILCVLTNAVNSIGILTFPKARNK